MRDTRSTLAFLGIAVLSGGVVLSRCSTGDPPSALGQETGDAVVHTTDADAGPIAEHPASRPAARDEARPDRNREGTLSLIGGWSPEGLPVWNTSANGHVVVRSKQEEFELPVADGRWSTAITGELELGPGVLEERRAHTVEVQLSGSSLHAFEGPFARVLVVDGVTRKGVKDCVIVLDRGRESRLTDPSAHPGIERERATFVQEVGPALRLPTPRTVTGYWIGSPEHAWRRTALHAETNDELVVALKRGCSLTIRNAGILPEEADDIRVDLLAVSTGEPWASIPLPADSLVLGHLPEGEGIARVVKKTGPAPGFVVHEERVVLAPSRHAELVIEGVLLKKREMRVRVSARLLLPLALPDVEELFGRELRVSLHPVGAVRQWVQAPQVVVRKKMRVVDEGQTVVEMEFTQGGVVPGSYVLIVDPLGHREAVEIRPFEWNSFDIDVPPPALTVVQVAESDDARAGSLRVMARSEEASHLATQREGPDGRAAFVVVTAPGDFQFLAADAISGRLAWTRARVGSGWNEVFVDLSESRRMTLRTSCNGAPTPLPGGWWERLARSFEEQCGEDHFLGISYPTAPNIGMERAVGFLALQGPGHYAIPVPSLAGYGLPAEIDIVVESGAVDELVMDVCPD